MIAVIDADSILYKYASINQDIFSWDGEEDVVELDLEGAIRNMVQFVDEIQEITKADDRIIVLSPKRTFRYDVDEMYKANRKPPKAPLELLPVLREYMSTEMGAITPSYIEADDYCVALVTSDPSKYVLCHIDKDLNQAEGNHYNYTSQESYKVTEEEATFFFYQQALEGDYVDGIKGCPKIGKKKSLKILSDVEPEEYWETIVAAYEKAGQTEDDAIRNARLVRMLRHGEYNFETEEITLWVPQRNTDNGTQ